MSRVISSTTARSFKSSSAGSSYAFRTQLNIGESGESFICSKFPTLAKSTTDWTYDLIATEDSELFDKGIRIEIKTDVWAEKTGNIAVEIVSIFERQSMSALARASEHADCIIYFLPESKKLLLFTPGDLLALVQSNPQYRIKWVKNESYNSVVVLVPMKDLSRMPSLQIVEEK